MAILTNWWTAANNQCRAFVQYNDAANNRVTAIGCENDSPWTMRVSVYPAGGATPILVHDCAPGEHTVRNVPGGQNYSLDSYDVSLRVLA